MYLYSFKNTRNLSKEKRVKKKQYGREKHKNLSENEKQRLVEYRVKYYKIWKKGPFHK